jgi:hypothetical protein
MRPRQSFNLVTAVILSSLVTAPPAFSQTAPLPSEPQLCEKNQVGFRLLAVKREGPGVIVVEAEYENRSNIVYRLEHGTKQFTFIIDDSGETWTDKRDANGTRAIPSGSKVKDTIKFSRRIGGGDAKAVTFYNKVHVLNPVGKAGSYGHCTFEVKNVPISGS